MIRVTIEYSDGTGSRVEVVEEDAYATTINRDRVQGVVREAERRALAPLPTIIRREEA